MAAGGVGSCLGADAAAAAAVVVVDWSHSLDEKWEAVACCYQIQALI